MLRKSNNNNKRLYRTSQRLSVLQKVAMKIILDLGTRSRYLPSTSTRSRSKTYQVLKRNAYIYTHTQNIYILANNGNLLVLIIQNVKKRKKNVHMCVCVYIYHIYICIYACISSQVRMSKYHLFKYHHACHKIFYIL